MSTYPIPDTGLIEARLLTEGQQSRSLSWQDINHWTPEQGVLWMHLDIRATDARDWICNQSGLGEFSAEALLAEETRPRSEKHQDALHLALRGINLNPGEDPEDMVAIRIYADAGRIITTRRRKMMAIREITGQMDSNQGPTTTSGFITTLISLLCNTQEDAIQGLEDHVDDIEQQVVEHQNTRLRPELAELRRDAVVIRRYLAPQREALSRLFAEKIDWFAEVDKLFLRDLTDRLIRNIEDLDAVRERAVVTQEEMSSYQSEQMNRRMYVLSLLSAIFLPLGFLTGLLGVNVSGIPGSDNNHAFLIFSGMLFFIFLLQLFFFRKNKWM